MEWIWIKIMKGIRTVIKFNPWDENLLDFTFHACDYLPTLNTLQSSRDPWSMTCPTWLPENETQVSIFSTLSFSPWSNRSADTTNHSALTNTDSTKKPDYTGCEVECVVCCCDANAPTKEVFLLLGVKISGKDLSSQHVCKHRHWWTSYTFLWDTGRCLQNQILWKWFSRLRIPQLLYQQYLLPSCSNVATSTCIIRLDAKENTLFSWD